MKTAYELLQTGLADVDSMKHNIEGLQEKSQTQERVKRRKETK